MLLEGERKTTEHSPAPSLRQGNSLTPPLQADKVSLLKEFGRGVFMQVLVKAQFQLFGTVKKADGLYIAHCPPLDITTQGNTEAEAKKNLAP